MSEGNGRLHNDTDGHGTNLLDALGITEATLPEIPRRELMAMVANVISRADLIRQQLDPKSRDVYDSCALTPVGSITPQMYQEMYDREAIAARVVEVLPKESWQSQPTVYETEDGEDETQFETDLAEVIKGLRGEESYFQDEEGNPLWAACEEADIHAGITGSSLMFLGLDDISEGEDLTKDPTEGTKPEKLLFVRTFPGSLWEVAEVETDKTSPRIGMPTRYNIQFASVDQLVAGPSLPYERNTVHWRRVIHITDRHHKPSTSITYGCSRMEPVWNQLQGLRKLYAGSPEMYWKGAFPGIGFSAHPALGAMAPNAKVDLPGLERMMGKYEDGLQRWFALTGLQAQQFSPQVVDPTPQINVQIEAICIKLGMPIRIFKGSERGELASSQDDSAWNDRLTARRNSHITPYILIPLIDRLINLGILTTPSGYSIWWADLTSKSDDEIATTAQKIITVLKEYTGGDIQSVMAPHDMYTGLLQYTEDEADNFLENAAEHMEEKMNEQVMMEEDARQREMAGQQEAIERGIAADPTNGTLGPTPGDFPFDTEDEEETTRNVDADDEDDDDFDFGDAPDDPQDPPPEHELFSVLAQQIQQVTNTQQAIIDRLAALSVVPVQQTAPVAFPVAPQPVSNVVVHPPAVSVVVGSDSRPVVVNGVPVVPISFDQEVDPAPELTEDTGWDFELDIPLTANAKKSLKGGRWVTIQGTHVYMKGGKILAGPKGTIGKAPKDLPPRSPGSSGGKKSGGHEGPLKTKDLEAKAAEQHKLASEARKGGDLDKARHHVAAAYGYQKAAGHVEKGKHAAADVAHKTAEQFAKGERKLGPSKEIEAKKKADAKAKETAEKDAKKKEETAAKEAAKQKADAEKQAVKDKEKADKEKKQTEEKAAKEAADKKAASTAKAQETKAAKKEEKKAAEEQAASQVEIKTKHEVALPKDKKRLTIDQAGEAVKQMGYTITEDKYDLRKKTSVTTIMDKDGKKHTLDSDELKEFVYAGAKHAPSDTKIKGAESPPVKEAVPKVTDAISAPAKATKKEGTSAAESGAKPLADISSFPRTKDGYFDYANTLLAHATKTHGEWGDGLDDKQMKAIDDYRGPKYASINNALRNPKKMTPAWKEEYEHTTKQLDRTIASAPPSKEDGILYRGVDKDFKGKLEVGAVFTDGGYGSISSNEKIAGSFAQGGGAIIEMKVPKGTKMASVDAAKAITDSRRSETENEYLLPRGVKYKVTGKRTDPERGDIITVEIVND